MIKAHMALARSPGTQRGADALRAYPIGQQANIHSAHLAPLRETQCLWFTHLNKGNSPVL
jgi:hypothetical protein